jgi:hypothetical protein
VSEIPNDIYDQIPPRSILIVRGTDEEAQAVKEKVGLTTTVFPVKRDTDIFCIVEESLNAAGWFKRMT